MKTVLLALPFLALPFLVEGGEVTFNRDIAPIIYQNCSSCHRPGESAPFALLSYDDVSRRARTIGRVIEDRYMPPWHADAETSANFVAVRKLADEEIERFLAWVEQGKPEGDPDSAPEPPQFTDGWQLGEPDLVISMDEGYEVPAEGPDIYRNFAIPLDLPEDKWVKAVELRPSARSVVHHALFFLDDSGTARSLEGRDGRPGFAGMAFRRSGSLGGYVPGVTPRMLPGDLALPLPAGSDFVLSTHFHPSGKREVEKTKVGLFFADKPPSRQINRIQLPPAFGRGAGIDIAPGETDFSIEDRFVLPVDVELVKIGGHAHYICSEMTMTATLPDGSVKNLLHIPDWDLDWQDDYHFREGMTLPAGTELHAVVRYDNSAENPDNPFAPPRRIRWGRESTDEMGSITLSVVAADAADEGRLRMSRAMKNAGSLTGIASELRHLSVARRLPQIVSRLDRNGDGDLEEAELPERMRRPLLDRLDVDGSGSLDPSEIQTLKDWLESLEEKRGNRSEI